MSALNWSWWGLPSTITLLVAWVAAVIVLRTRPDRPVNRRLFVVLLLEGLFVGCSSGLLFFVDRAAAAHWLGIIATATMVALVPQYLSFLGASLQTPLVAPFRHRFAAPVLTLASVIGALFVLAYAAEFVTEPYAPVFARWNYQLREWGQRASQLHGLVSIFGLVAALAAYRQTPAGSLRRARAGWFAIAFGIRDAYAGIFQMLYPVIRPVDFWGDFVYNPGIGAIYLLYVLLLSYGVLQAQLFDINLRLKFALRQSTVAAAITTAFFVGSELLENVVPVDGVIIGVIAAGACVLALRPLQRLATRIVNGVMQDVEDTPAYLDARKADVYRTAVEGILDDAVVSPKEQRVLDRLRKKIGLSEAEAELIQAEVTARLRARTPSGRRVTDMPKKDRSTRAESAGEA
jgi:hypothetical protein